MSFEFMKSMIEQYAGFGLGTHVTFTGGEPFLLGKDLLGAVQCATTNGLTSRIVTNGYWGRTRAHARTVLTTYQAAGLTELNVSVDDFHQAFVPIESIKNIHDICVEIDMTVLLAHKGLKSSRVTIEYLESVLQHPLCNIETLRQEERSAKEGAASLQKQYLYATGGCVPVGPNAHLATDDDLEYGCSPNRYRYRCSGILRDLVVSPTDGVDLCCGVVGTEIPELTFEGISKHGLRAILEIANQDLIVNWLALEGPYGIKKYLESVDPELRFSKRYVGACHLCHDVLTNPRARALLRNVAPDKIEEIAYRRVAFDATRQCPQVCDRMYQQPVE